MARRRDTYASDEGLRQGGSETPTPQPVRRPHRHASSEHLLDVRLESLRAQRTLLLKVGADLGRPLIVQRVVEQEAIHALAGRCTICCGIPARSGRVCQACGDGWGKARFPAPVRGYAIARLIRYSCEVGACLGEVSPTPVFCPGDCSETADRDRVARVPHQVHVRPSCRTKRSAGFHEVETSMRRRDLETDREDDGVGQASVGIRMNHVLQIGLDGEPRRRLCQVGEFHSRFHAGSAARW